MGSDYDVELGTNFIFSPASLLVGMGSVLNIAGNYFQYRAYPSGAEADTDALRRDWNVIGHDMRKAFRMWENSNDNPARK